MAYSPLMVQPMRDEVTRLGVEELRRRFGEIVVSGVYRNAAVGFEGADFLNLVAGFTSDAGPAEICRQIEEIHDLAGRQRGQAECFHLRSRSGLSGRNRSRLFDGSGRDGAAAGDPDSSRS